MPVSSLLSPSKTSLESALWSARNIHALLFPLDWGVKTPHFDQVFIPPSCESGKVTLCLALGTDLGLKSRSQCFSTVVQLALGQGEDNSSHWDYPASHKKFNTPARDKTGSGIITDEEP